jgi:hypothetical protein
MHELVLAEASRPVSHKNPERESVIFLTEDHGRKYQMPAQTLSGCCAGIFIFGRNRNLFDILEFIELITSVCVCVKPVNPICVI